MNGTSTKSITEDDILTMEKMKEAYNKIVESRYVLYAIDDFSILKDGDFIKVDAHSGGLFPEYIIISKDNFDSVSDMFSKEGIRLLHIRDEPIESSISRMRKLCNPFISDCQV